MTLNQLFAQEELLKNLIADETQEEAEETEEEEEETEEEEEEENEAEA